jgi:hypothetical protein
MSLTRRGNGDGQFFDGHKTSTAQSPFIFFCDRSFSQLKAGLFRAVFVRIAAEFREN